MRPARSALAREALEKSLEIREEYGYDFRSPLCIYELCDRMGVKVRSVDNVSMEGFYVAKRKPAIILSALRPLSRRVFTCAHELGHHVFCHGSTLDELCEEANSGKFSPNEFLADSFAGLLLMPVQGVRRAFAVRQWSLSDGQPEQYFVIACSFGVGYKTLLAHLSYSLMDLPRARLDALQKVRLSFIRQRLLGEPTKDPLVVADLNYASSTLDAEVGMHILLPSGAEAESDALEFVVERPTGRQFRALRPGLVRVHVPGSPWAIVVRISRLQYAGLSNYRHLEEADDD